MKQLFIHFGAHKTASTAIQKFLDRQPSTGDGWCYIPRSAMTRKPDKWLQTIARKRHREKDILAAAADVGRMLNQLPGDRILISNENLLGPMPGLEDRHPSPFYPYLDQLVLFLTALKPHVALHGLLFVREQYSFIRSCYQFRVHKGSAMSFAEFHGRLAGEPLSWLRVADALKAPLGQHMKVLPFELFKSHAAHVRTHLLRFHPAFEHLRRLPRANVSISPFALFIVQRLRAHGVRIHKQTSLFSKKIEADIQSATLPGNGLFPPVDQLEAIAMDAAAKYFHPIFPGWKSALKAAIRHYVDAPVKPFDLPGDTIASIRAQHRSDNEALFAKYMKPDWLKFWG